MPLSPAVTDKFQKVGLPGSASTLSSPGYTIGNNSITVGSTTNHPTDTLYTFAIDQVQVINGVATRVAGTYCEFEGIVTGGTTIGSVVLKYGNAQNYAAGALTRVYIPVSSNRENALVDGLNVDHNGRGNHKDLTGTNQHTVFGLTDVASAVNDVRATNAIAGAAPVLAAEGSDTNIDVYLRGKNTGVAHAENPELISNFVASGGVVAISSGLVGTFSDMIFYAVGKRYKKLTVPNKTYTINKDTYVDADPTNSATVVYTEVANNAASPALAATSIRLAKVVTSGSAITSIVQVGTDSLGNLIYPQGSVGGNNIQSYKVQRLNSVTPVVESKSMVQTGYEVKNMVVVATLTIPVTFPVPFKGIPIVTASYAGDSATNSGYGNGGINLANGVVVRVNAITTVGMQLSISKADGTNFPASGFGWVTWIAIGE